MQKRGICALLAAGMLTLSPVTAAAADVWDVNLDGACTVADAVVLCRYLVGNATPEEAQQTDLNGDGVCNGFDLAALKQRLLSPAPPENVVAVSDIAGLFEAMRGAKPGDVIEVAPGVYDYTVYQGAQKIDTDAAGTADAPITLRAADPANPPVLTGTSAENGYVLHLKGDYWIVDGIRVTTSQKGIVLDHSSHTVLQNCEVSDTGSEAVALRDGSSNCVVRACSIHDTGLVTPGYGEGVYIGSAYSTTGFDYKCDNNLVENCVFKNVAAEHIDVKEYTTGTEIRGCTFYGDGMTGQNFAGSFVDIAGNDCYVHDNEGYRDGNPNIVAAFELHEQREGWGYGCRFERNTLHMDREYGEVNTDRRMYVVDGWFSDFTVKGDRVDYGAGLHDAVAAYYNSDTMTFLTE